MKTRIPVLFDYPVTRAVTIPYFTPIALGLGLLLTAFFILFGVISAGYELVTVVSGTYNLTTSGWYENLRLPEWFLPQSQCTASILKVGECMHHTSVLTANKRPCNFGIWIPVTIFCGS